jgi:hypothetical protein
MVASEVALIVVSLGKNRVERKELLVNLLTRACVSSFTDQNSSFRRKDLSEKGRKIVIE